MNMCRIRTLIMVDNGEILKDTVIGVKGLRLNVIDTPAFCIYVRRNANGYENFILKYTNSTEETDSINSKSYKTLMTVGRNSGCIYTFQYKSDVGLSEMTEMKRLALQGNGNARYQKNIEQQFRLLKQMHEELL